MKTSASLCKIVTGTGFNLIPTRHTPEPVVDPEPGSYIAPYDDDESCRSHLNGEEMGIEGEKTTMLLSGPKVDSVLNLLNLLIDGGNTEQLLTDIQSSWPEEGYELYSTLISESPYLSDTSMIKAIEKEDVLLSGMITDVLIANPQSAKSGEILDAVDSRYDPMPDYMMADIMQGLDQIGALESLESKIGYWENYRTQAVNELIREFISDTTLINPEDSLINLLQDETSLESKYRLAFALGENNQTEEALEILNEIPESFSMTYEVLETYNQYRDYFAILMMMNDSCLNPRQLDSSSVQSLFLIMNSNLPLISSYARGLLLKGRKIEYTEKLMFPTGLKSYPSYYYLNSVKSSFPLKRHLILFPNPAGDYVIAYFNIQNYDESGVLLINDIHGKNLGIIKLAAQQNQLVIDLSGYSDGVYLISLIVNNKIMASKKLLKGQ